MNAKSLYNPEGVDSLDETLIGGDPTGILNFNKSRYPWATKLYMSMRSCFWLPATVDTTGEKKAYLALGVDDQKSYDRVISSLSFIDSAIADSIADNLNAYITNKIINGCLIEQAAQEVLHCYVAGTEVLTDQGFLDFRDLTMQHKVANYTKEGEIYFTNPKSIVNSLYSGDIDVYKNVVYSLAVTPEHKMVRISRRYNNNIQLVESRKCGTTNNDFPVAGRIKGARELTMTERMGIIFQAGGGVVNKGAITKDGISFVVKVSKQRKIDRLYKLLEGGDIRYSLGKGAADRARGYEVFYIWLDPKYVCKDFSWVDMNVSEQYVHAFIEELMHWDGCLSNNMRRYVNTNKKAIDKVMGLCSLAGYRTHYYESITKGCPYNVKPDFVGIPYYQLNIIDKSYIAGRTLIKHTEYYEGTIHCCEVDTGMIIVRHNGKVAVSGNSSSYAVMLSDTVEDSDRVFNLYKTDLKLAAKNTSIAKMFSGLRSTESVMHESLKALDAGDINIDQFKQNIKDAEVTPEKIFYALIANQLVEGIFFQTGFATIFYLGATKKMLGSADMIKEIMKDELHHLLLFERMIKEFVKENPNLVWFTIRAEVNRMFEKAYQIESAWMHYVLGHAFTKEVTDATVAYFIKARMQAINMYDEHGDPYGHAERTPLVLALKQREVANETRTNFFEGTVANYTKMELDWDNYRDGHNEGLCTDQPTYDDALKDIKAKRKK